MLKKSPRQLEALKIVARGDFFPDLVKEDDGYYARWRDVTDNPWVDHYARESVATLASLRGTKLHETFLSLHDAWLSALQSSTGELKWDSELEIKAFQKTLQDWYSPLFLPKLKITTDPKTLSPVYPPRDADFSPRGKKSYLLALGYAYKRFNALSPVERAADLHVDIKAGAILDSDAAKLKLVVHVDGEVVTSDEIRQLLSQHSNLVFFRDRWILVDVNILKMALRAFEQVEGKPLTKPEMVTFALGLGHVGPFDLEDVAVHGWLRGILSREEEGTRTLLSATKPKALKDLPLRPYQEKGALWIKFLTDHNLGALLADDMGLGKTLQVIAWMRLQFASSPSKGRGLQSPRFLVVCPLTLVANWKHELEKFAPELLDRVTITNYTQLTRNYHQYSNHRWDGLILDEAQFIKNPKTQIHKAVCSLRPEHRIALTGTPIENSLSDLWSIEEFLNPGFLGDLRSFEKKSLERIRHAMEPFMLMRKKSDPGIAAELPEKHEEMECCELNDKEHEDYEHALAIYRHSAKKQGDVFALIMALKLICDGEAKLDRLMDLIKEIFANGESCLIFTQFAKVGAKIARRFEKDYGRRFPFLHGALTPKMREHEIDSFTQDKNPSAFILSLKAGGFGLNLTKATHVIHFDRWWNPAVEEQATDRAHRIGQTKDVLVHNFVTLGTIEERVEQILARKENLRDLLKIDAEAFWKLVKLQ